MNASHKERRQRAMIRMNNERLVLKLMWRCVFTCRHVYEFMKADTHMMIITERETYYKENIRR